MSELGAADRQTPRPRDPADGSSLPAVVGSGGFGPAARLVLDYLNQHVPMGFWSITRVENGRQTYLYLDDNTYGLRTGGSHPWEDSYCIHMSRGATPRIAPDARVVPLYAAARVNETVPIAAYAGVPIEEPDGSLFGAICGLDTRARPDLTLVGPVLSLLGELLTVTLACDRALHHAERRSKTALTEATTDSMTGVHNRRAWDDMIVTLDSDFDTYADPTIVVIVDLDNLKETNDGPGGHAAGDRLIRAAAKVMRGNIRDHDFLARIGGDEFGIILTNCPTDLAPTLADRINEALDEAGVPASVGWAPLSTQGDAQGAMELADQAMYRAKSRRRVRSEPQPTQLAGVALPVLGHLDP